MYTALINGLICDGSGKEPEAKDLLLKDNRIADMAEPGAFARSDAKKIDVSGKIIAPGFIDAHAHGDTRKLKFRQRRSALLQGITTEVDGNCGDSDSCVPGECGVFKWQNLDEYAAIVNDLKVPVNTVVLAGHNSIRALVMGNKPDTPSGDEIKAMRKLLENAFSSGAAGWSSGLTYFPGKFAGEEELKALAEVTCGSEKIYATHMRSEGDTLFEAVEEAVNVAKAGSRRLQISHLKTIFPRNFSKIDHLLEMIERHRQDIDIHADRYPYIYSSTGIRQTLPPPYDKIVDISRKLQESASFQQEIVSALKHSPRDLSTAILVSRNMTLPEIAAEENCSLEETVMKIIMKNSGQTAAYKCMSEANLNRFLALPYLCAGSDGIATQLDDPEAIGHPRAVGTFPKFFRMVSKTSSTGEAVRKMTSLPASIFRIPERGLIRKGYIADLVIFDAGKMDSAASFGRENLMPQGIDKVFVDGKIAWNSAEPEKVGHHGRFIPVN